MWECEPQGSPETAQLRPALGAFNHEAVEVVSKYQSLFLTEDDPEGRLYRFRPTVWPDLSSGSLEAAHVDDDGFVTWVPVDATMPERTLSTSPFRGPEGLAMSGNSLFMSTKLDRRPWSSWSDTTVPKSPDRASAPTGARCICRLSEVPMAPG